VLPPPPQEVLPVRLPLVLFVEQQQEDEGLQQMMDRAPTPFLLGIFLLVLLIVLE
jgi:hypothetical protein